MSPKKEWSLQAVWSRLWFEPGSAVNLAAARIIVASHALWVLLSRDLASVTKLPPFFWHDVETTSTLRYLIFPGHPVVEQALQALAAAALAGAILGLAPRICCFVAALLLYHLAPFETILWMPDPYERGFTISVLALLTLSAARCGDALTILRRRPERVEPWVYTWPLRLSQLFLAQVYFFSGWSKLRMSGLGWISAENVRRWLLVPSQQEQTSVFRDLGPWLADRPWLCVGIGSAALLIDLLFIATPFSRWLRRLLVPAAALGHVGILLAMNIFFINLPQLLIFVNWEWLGVRLRSRPDADQWERVKASAEVA